MGNYPPNVTFYLRIYLRGSPMELGIKLREKQWNRFRNNTVNQEDNDKLFQFFVCSTIDGKQIGINLQKMQSANLLEEISPYVEDSKIYKGSIKLLFHSREDYIEIPSTTQPEQLYDFFNCLENGRDFAGIFLSFPDDDDEEMIINIDELLYIEVPQFLFDKGREEWSREMGIED